MGLKGMKEEEIKCEQCGGSLFKASFGDEYVALKCITPNCGEIIRIGSRGPMFIEEE